mmetsp:Transcript_112924/g.364529  ORF Transcript_112924/g.364529 Transcript_112924/m.364529 type:complete len:197 (-) Transcript_112924:66-656(-)
MLPRPPVGAAKEGHLTLFYRELRWLCPGTRFYFVVRDPAENVRSIADRLALGPEGLRRPPRIVARADLGWREVLNMSYAGVREESALGTLVGRWNLMARLYLDAPKGAMALVRYEDLVAEATWEAEVRRVAAELGGAEPNVTAALGQLAEQAQRPGRHRGLSARAVLGDGIVDEIYSRCAENMRLLGYTPSRRGGA